MKTRRYLPHGITLLCLLLAVLVCSSWVANIYGLPVRNLLSSEGVRWMLSNIDENFQIIPFGRLLILSLGLGIVCSSGLFQQLWQYRFRRKMHLSLSLKQKRALLLTALSGMAYWGFILFATFSPSGILMGVTGSLLRSPLFYDWVPLLSFFFCIIGLFYGIASGQFRNDRDVLGGVCSFIAHYAWYIVYLLLLSQCWGIFCEARFDACLGWNAYLLSLLQQLSFYMPLAFYIVLRFFAR